jgi:hypothetical protein
VKKCFIALALALSVAFAAVAPVSAQIEAPDPSQSESPEPSETTEPSQTEAPEPLGQNGVPSAETLLAYPTCTDWSQLNHGIYYVQLPSVGYNTAAIDCVLGYGNVNAGVFVLQNALKTCYGQNIAVDGVYGSATVNAVENVQAWEGVPVDGVYGPTTRQAMNWPRFIRATGAFEDCLG